MKKALSLILVIILLFSAVPLTAGAVIAGSAARGSGGAAIPKKENTDLAETGADLDLAGTGDYSGSCNSGMVTWYYLSATRTLTFTGSGQIRSNYTVTPENDNWTLDYTINNTDSFKSGDFYWLSSLVDHIMIGEGITYIDHFTFWNFFYDIFHSYNS